MAFSVGLIPRKVLPTLIINNLDILRSSLAVDCLLPRITNSENAPDEVR